MPVAQLHVISRYSGAEPDAAPLHASAGQWEKAKRKAAEQARDTAAELLALYAARAARQATPSASGKRLRGLRRRFRVSRKPTTRPPPSPP